MGSARLVLGGRQPVLRQLQLPVVRPRDLPLYLIIIIFIIVLILLILSEI